MFIGYIVPSMPENIQKDFEWINDILKVVSSEEEVKKSEEKTEIYRSDVLSPPYIESMKNAGLVNCNSDGTYPLPMISHSTSFPFSLLPEEAEISIVKHFTDFLNRNSQDGADPWRCKEGYGQAFLVWGVKPKKNKDTV